MSSKTYDILKFVGLIIGYVGIFAASMAEIWGFQYGTEISASLAAAAVLLNSIVKASSDAYWQSHDIVEKEEDGDTDGE